MAHETKQAGSGKAHPHARHHAVSVAAAVEPVHEHIHETEAPPTVFALTPQEQALVATLQFLSAYELKHVRKAAPDVGTAFDATALAAIEASPALGGKARADQVRADVAAHEELLHIASVLAPLTRLVGQNLLARGATLALSAGEVLKVARSLSRTQPHLLEQLGALDKWTHAHHAGGHPAPPAGPTTP